MLSAGFGLKSEDDDTLLILLPELGAYISITMFLRLWLRFTSNFCRALLMKHRAHNYTIKANSQELPINRSKGVCNFSLNSIVLRITARQEEAVGIYSHTSCCYR